MRVEKIYSPIIYDIIVLTDSPENEQKAKHLDYVVCNEKECDYISQRKPSNAQLYNMHQAKKYFGGTVGAN